MTAAHKITLALASALFIVLCFVTYGLIKEHDNKLLAQQAVATANTQLATNAQSIAANQKTLDAAVSALQQQKQVIVTPQQIVTQVPKYITLPDQIKEVVSAPSPTLPNAPSPETETTTANCKTGDLVIPADSAKAFFDAQVTCQQNALTVDSDAKTIATLNSDGTIKDTEIAALKTQIAGGTKWQRTLTAAKWVGIGVAAGVVTGLVVHH